MLCPWGQNDVIWRGWATIVTDAASLSHLECDEASNTFLVLGPIDLTNGRAGMIAPVAIHAARDLQLG
jgi:hypothetical protein